MGCSGQQRPSSPAFRGKGGFRRSGYTVTVGLAASCRHPENLRETEFKGNGLVHSMAEILQQDEIQSDHCSCQLYRENQ